MLGSLPVLGTVRNLVILLRTFFCDLDGWKAVASHLGNKKNNR